MNFVQLLVSLITTDISIAVMAAGTQIERPADEFTNSLAVALFSKYKKGTKLQYTPLLCNFFLTIIAVICAFTEYMDKGYSFFQTVVAAARKISGEPHSIIIGLLLLMLLTAFFMLVTYRLIKVKPAKDTKSGNRYLTTREIDRELFCFKRAWCPAYRLFLCT